MSGVAPGDLIEVTRIAHPDHEDALRVGGRYVVEAAGETASGALWVTLEGSPAALVSSLGDEWRVVQSAVAS